MSAGYLVRGAKASSAQQRAALPLLGCGQLLIHGPQPGGASVDPLGAAVGIKVYFDQGRVYLEHSHYPPPAWNTIQSKVILPGSASTF